MSVVWFDIDENLGRRLFNSALKFTGDTTFASQPAYITLCNEVRNAIDAIRSSIWARQLNAAMPVIGNIDDFINLFLPQIIPFIKLTATELRLKTDPKNVQSNLEPLNKTNTRLRIAFGNLFFLCTFRSIRQFLVNQPSPLFADKLPGWLLYGTRYGLIEFKDEVVPLSFKLSERAWYYAVCGMWLLARDLTEFRLKICVPFVPVEKGRVYMLDPRVAFVGQLLHQFENYEVSVPRRVNEQSPKSCKPPPMKEHQTFACSRAVSVCRNLSGMLFIHGVGTGKTRLGWCILGGFLFKKGKKLKASLIMPDIVIDQWRKTGLMLGLMLYKPDLDEYVMRDNQELKFFTYDDLVQNTSRCRPASAERWVDDNLVGHIVIMDEAHRLALIVANYYGAELQNIERAILSVEKLYLLTGTPMMTGWGDFAALINSVSKLTLFPADSALFENQFNRKKKIGRFEKFYGVFHREAMKFSLRFKTTLNAAVFIRSIPEWIRTAIWLIGAAPGETTEIMSKLWSLITSYVNFWPDSIFGIPLVQNTPPAAIQGMEETMALTTLLTLAMWVFGGSAPFAFTLWLVTGFASTTLAVQWWTKGLVGALVDDITEIDPAEILEIAAPYISFYNAAEDKNVASKDLVADHPVTTSRFVAVVPTPFQRLVIFLNGNLNGARSEPWALVAAYRVEAAGGIYSRQTKEDAIETYFEHMCIAGNLSSDNIICNTRRIEELDEDEKLRTGLKTFYQEQEHVAKEAVAHILDQDGNLTGETPLYIPAARFSWMDLGCFEAVKRDKEEIKKIFLLKISDSPEGFTELSAKMAAEKLEIIPIADNAPAQAVHFECPKFRCALSIIVSELHNNCTASYTVNDKVFMPIVYSNFLHGGFDTFSAYLRELGLRHIVLHDNDPMKKEKIFLSSLPQNLGALGIKPWSGQATDVDRMIEDLRSNDVICCMLLHPDMREGLDLVMNPCIIKIEPLNGPGVDEQLEGRIKRTVDDYHKAIFHWLSGSPLSAENRLYKRAYTICLVASGQHITADLSEFLIKHIPKLNIPTVRAIPEIDIPFVRTIPRYIQKGKIGNEYTFIMEDDYEQKTSSTARIVDFAKNLVHKVTSKRLEFGLTEEYELLHLKTAYAKMYTEIIADDDKLKNTPDLYIYKRNKIQRKNFDLVMQNMKSDKLVLDTESPCGREVKAISKDKRCSVYSCPSDLGDCRMLDATTEVAGCCDDTTRLCSYCEDNLAVGLCDRCRQTAYCSTQCQTDDWTNGHKNSCNSHSI